MKNLACVYGVACCLVTLGTVNVANAYCDEIDLDDGDNIAIVGEAEVWVPGISAYWTPTGGRALGVCWQDSSSNWNLEITACDPGDSTFEELRINAGDGDDIVVAHPSTGATFHCEGASIGRILPAYWDSSDFNVGIVAMLGEGADTFHGSPMDDQAWGNNYSEDADDSRDRMCGYAGDDNLSGDDDHGSQLLEHDCMHGGGGTDYCDGGAGNGWSPDPDDAWACDGNESNTRVAFSADCRDNCAGAPDLSPSLARCPTYCN